MTRPRRRSMTRAAHSARVRGVAAIPARGVGTARRLATRRTVRGAARVTTLAAHAHCHSHLRLASRSVLPSSLASPDLRRTRPQTALLQTAIPSEMRGRVSSALMIARYLLSSVAIAIGSALIAQVGLRTYYLGNALVIAALGLAVLRARGFVRPDISGVPGGPT